MHEFMPIGEDARTPAFHAGIEEALEAALDIHQLQGPGPEHERLGFIGARRGFVDDPHIDPEALQRRRHGHADRPGACNQNLLAHLPRPP
jgi:hypothetical protein